MSSHVESLVLVVAIKLAVLKVEDGVVRARSGRMVAGDAGGGNLQGRKRALLQRIEGWCNHRVPRGDVIFVIMVLVPVPHSSAGEHDEEEEEKEQEQAEEEEGRRKGKAIGPLMRSAAEDGRRELSSESAATMRSLGSGQFMD